MSNEAIAGFIVTKTIQQNPLRYYDANFNDYRDKNMIMYIQKKYADLKKRTGVKFLPKQTLANTQLQVKLKAQEGNKEYQGNYELQPEVVEIMQRVLDKEQLENLLNFQVIPKRSKNWKKKPISVQQKLAMMMNDNIEQAQLDDLYQSYKRQNLKQNLKEVKTSIKNSKDASKSIGKHKGYQNIELDDQEQVNFFMKKLCEDQNINACTVLDIKNQELTFKEDQWDEMERWRNIVQKRITQEQLLEIMREEELKQNRELVKIFKETRIDQFDPDFFKSKVKMTTMKRVNQAQDLQYHKFFVSNGNQVNGFTQEDFRRKNQQYQSPKSHFMDNLSKVSRTTRPQTSVSRTLKTQTSIKTDIEFNKFLKQCDVIENNFKKDKNILKEKFRSLDNIMEKAGQYLSMDKPQFEREPNQEFEKFKKQRLFKKKFVTYLIDKVEKQSDLLSEKIKSSQSKQFIERILSEEQ
ncbi:unnamed protein product [Paramecium primaurelia]|uniref:Uncharacterized protein n=1 Tax=Paramecium primaurelia TaxID=5886 RepID=A0A8S1KE05_PARPR|nr:unnamed protein product [Paramecium primaurelia]